MSEYFACQELECEHLNTSKLDYCEKTVRCPYAWIRRSFEDRQRDQERVEKEAKG